MSRPPGPMEHRLAEGYTAAYALPGARLAPLLPGGWRPAPLGAGLAVLAVAYQDFAASPVGPYRQVSLAVPVHVGPGGAPARAWPLLPILWQSFGTAADLFPTLGLCVVRMVVTAPAAADYSRDIWGEPAVTGMVQAGVEGGEVCLTAAAAPTAVAAVLPLPAGAGGGGTGREDRRYRLFSHLAGQPLADWMHVQAPCRRRLLPARRPIRWTEGSVALAGGRCLCLLASRHGQGRVTFGGPTPLG